MATTSPNPPPYTSYGIFKTVTTETLAESVVPTGPLDRRVLDGLSGADYGSLMSALRFLGLVDEQRKATASYRDLVQAAKEPDKFKAKLLAILTERYKPITGSVDLAHGTITELEKAFRDAGVTPGQMLTKTVRFYVKALADAGISVSPHILKAKRTPSAKKNGASERARAKTKRQPRRPEEAVTTTFNGGHPNTVKMVMLPVANGSLTLHGTFNVFDLVGDERELVFAIIDKMKAFEADHPPEED